MDRTIKLAPFLLSFPYDFLLSSLSSLLLSLLSLLSLSSLFSYLSVDKFTFLLSLFLMRAILRGGSRSNPMMCSGAEPASL